MDAGIVIAAADRLHARSMEMQRKALVIHKRDNVAVAVSLIRAGERVVVERENEEEVAVRDDIAFGHKFALTDLEPGELVFKYGEVIGEASKRIHRGEHVHVHNMESRRGRGDLEAS